MTDSEPRGGGQNPGREPAATSPTPPPLDAVRQPFWGKCRSCGHLWPLFYLPMPVETTSAICAAARCPMCAAEASEITPARQSSGVLLEANLPRNIAADQEWRRREDFPSHLRVPRDDQPLCHGCYRPADRGPDVEIADEHWALIAPPPNSRGQSHLCVICMHERLASMDLEAGSVPARFTSGPFRETRARLPTALDEDLVEILGRPNFACGGIAEAFRQAGRTIPRKAEAEQAFVLHWLLTLYLQHGAEWRRLAADQLDALRRSLQTGDQTDG